MSLLLAGRDKKVLSRCSCLGLPVADRDQKRHAAARKRHEQMKAQRLIKAESAPRVIVFAPAFLYTTVCVLRVGISCARARKVVRKERDSYIHVMYVGLFQRDRGPPEYRSRIS